VGGQKGKLDDHLKERGQPAVVPRVAGEGITPSRGKTGQLSRNSLYWFVGSFRRSSNLDGVLT